MRVSRFFVPARGISRLTGCSPFSAWRQASLSTKGESLMTHLTLTSSDLAPFGLQMQEVDVNVQTSKVRSLSLFPARGRVYQLTLY